MSAAVARQVLAAGLVAWLLPLSALAFTFEDNQGKVHRLADYRGRWVVVNFWATWCPPCLKEIPELAALHEANDHVRVLGVALQYRDPAYVGQFAEQLLVPYPVILGDAASAAQVGSVRGLPTTFLYDPCGRIVARQVGAVTRKDIEQFIHERSAKEQKAC